MDKRRAFTLIEMAIVLVIVGLIAAVVTYASSMIAGSQLRSTMSAAQSYIAAAAQFSEKYRQYPGDFSTATSQWGAEGTCPASANTVPKTATCNGDGNGRIGTGFGGASAESFRFWQHLADAQFIDGKFTGVSASGGSGNFTTPLLNSPKLSLDKAVLYVEYVGPKSAAANSFFNGDYRHVMFVGVQSSVSVTAPYGALLSPDQAAAMDEKFDDGEPALGNIRGWRTSASYSNSGCTNSDTAAAGSAADYVMTSTAPGCSLMILMGF